LPTFIDADLQQFDTIWAAAGTPQTVFAITPPELVKATHGMVADLKA
jgi:prolyl-tRNA editing enzyme YbaK/EbsC (Cys-tRNA(Pro) deacylase)